MKIAIVGAGNAGTAVASDLSFKGHEVTLVKTSNSMHDDNFNYLLANDNTMVLDDFGEEKVCKIKEVTRDLSKISDAQVVILYIQTSYHEDVIQKMMPYLNEEQILLINPGYLSTAYVLKHAGDKKLTVAEATSSFIDCRIIEPGRIRVGFRNVRNPLGIYPVSKTEEAKALLNQMGYPFEYLGSVIEAALHNPNMMVHTVGAVMSIPRIENTNGNYVMYHEVFTPSVWKILEALDKEKMDVIEHFGLERISYVDMAKFRNSLDETIDAKESFFNYAMMPTRAIGPTKVDSRYITEDVPQGIVMLEALGKSLDIPTPIASSLIEIASAALGRDLRLEGRTPDTLGQENIDAIIQDTKEQQA